MIWVLFAKRDASTPVGWAGLEHLNVACFEPPDVVPELYRDHTKHVRVLVADTPDEATQKLKLAGRDGSHCGKPKAFRLRLSAFTAAEQATFNDVNKSSVIRRNQSLDSILESAV